MGSNMQAINLVVHSPITPEGKAALAQQVAAVHADQVHRYLRSLNCPSYQKEQLIQALLASDTISQ